MAKATIAGNSRRATLIIGGEELNCMRKMGSVKRELGQSIAAKLLNEVTIG